MSLLFEKNIRESCLERVYGSSVSSVIVSEATRQNTSKALILALIVACGGELLLNDYKV